MIQLLSEPINQVDLEVFNTAVADLLKAKRELESFRQRHSMLLQALERAAADAQNIAERVAIRDDRLKQFLTDTGLKEPIAPVSV